MSLSKFIIIKHEAERAGLHYDLRFRIPTSRKWASFAVRKGVPIETGIKVLAIRTPDHTEYGALLTGRIGSGYGKGKLTKWDGGYCNVEKYSVSHIVLNLNGNKVKGIYHLLSTGVFDKDYENKSYLLFKGKSITESTDMMGGNNTVRVLSIKDLQTFLEGEELKLLVDQEEMDNIHQSIMDFFSKNPSPKDTEIHSLADKLKMDPHSFEQHVYMILGSFLGAGRSKDFKGNYDPEQIKMGIAVEKEHTTSSAVAERIAKDHLAEIPDYYTRLKKMEAAGGVKD